MLFRSRPPDNELALTINNVVLPRVAATKFLGIIIYLREHIGLDFVNFGSKTYIELFTYLCRQIIELALYTHLNSAHKKKFITKSQFCGMPHRSKVIVLVK